MRRNQLLWMIFQVVFIIILLSPLTFAEEKGLARIESKIDRIIEKQTAFGERLAAVEEGQKAINQRIDDLKTFMLWGFGILFGGMGILIGFVIWDRRTALSPAYKTDQGTRR